MNRIIVTQNKELTEEEILEKELIVYTRKGNDIEEEETNQNKQ